MKKMLLVITTIILAASQLVAEKPKEKTFSTGLLVLAGGRYDNLRMCVGSDAGTKGGPIADVMLVTRYRFAEKLALSFHLPVMRPVLFGAAFKMLQFEPEFRFEMTVALTGSFRLVHGPGLGASFHYGPDYRSSPDNRGDSFFAAGPHVSYFSGIPFSGPWQKKNVIGIRAFYTPLFSRERSTGTVIGGALEYTFYF